MAVFILNKINQSWSANYLFSNTIRKQNFIFEIISKIKNLNLKTNKMYSPTQMLILLLPIIHKCPSHLNHFS